MLDRIMRRAGQILRTTVLQPKARGFPDLPAGVSKPYTVHITQSIFSMRPLRFALPQQLNLPFALVVEKIY